MQTPSTAQIRTAIEVLKRLDIRLNEHASHSLNQLSESALGGQYAARIESSAIEQTGRIKIVAAQLEHWRDELNQQRRQCVSHHV
jgi:hypothetical protein